MMQSHAVTAGTRCGPLVPVGRARREGCRNVARRNTPPPTGGVTYSPAVQAYRTPEKYFADLPGWPYAPRYSEQDGLRLHYVDEGGGNPVLLLHGEPSWGFLYRRLVPVLTGVARVVVPDYFGFGRSDKPLRIEDYTYDLHLRSIDRLVDELELSRLTVVVQDWGGPIGLRLAGRASGARRPARPSQHRRRRGASALSPEWLRFREFVRRLGTELVASRLIAPSCVRRRPDVLAAARRSRSSARGRSRDAGLPGARPRRSSIIPGGAMLRVRDELGVEQAALVPLLGLRSDLHSLAADGPIRPLGAGPAEIVLGLGHFLPGGARGEARSPSGSFASSPARSPFRTQPSWV